jgi:hypothetical protein
VVSAYGDPEAFGERAVEVMADLQKLPYDTLLYASPGKAEAERDVEKMAIAYHKQWNEEWTAVGMVDAVRPWDSLAEHTREATIRCMQAAIQQAREIHASDCAVHNEPAYPAGPCDCGALQQERDKQ